jgi:hypothetical protein
MLKQNWTRLVVEVTGSRPHSTLKHILFFILFKISKKGKKNEAQESQMVLTFNRLMKYKLIK